MSVQITETLNDSPGKFVYMVSLNGQPSQRIEIELDKLPEDIALLETDSAKIAALLNRIADDSAARIAEDQVQADKIAAIEVVDGQIVL